MKINSFSSSSSSLIFQFFFPVEIQNKDHLLIKVALVCKPNLLKMDSTIVQLKQQGQSKNGQTDVNL